MMEMMSTSRVLGSFLLSVYLSCHSVNSALVATGPAKLGNHDGSCQVVPLGMEHGHIRDEDITASSYFDFKSVGPQNARVRQDTYGGAWCPRNMIQAGVREWLQIDLNGDHLITTTETQGRFGGGQGQEFAQNYQLEYWRQNLGKWVKYTNHSGHDVLKGNDNTYVENLQPLHPPFVASKVRFIPHSSHPRTVCMRVELYGCKYLHGPESYTAPQGDEFYPNVFLLDVYDGGLSNNTNTGGLGVLTDGEQGSRLSFTERGIGAAEGWVGWKNKNEPVELEFIFNSVITFVSVTLTVYNKNDMGIEPLSQLHTHLSLDGSTYSGEYLKAVNQETFLSANGPLNITFPLKGRIGKRIKLQLFYLSKWIVLSEVSFKTGPLHENFSDTQETFSYQKETQEIGFVKENKANDKKIVMEKSSDMRQDGPPTPEQNTRQTQVNQEPEELEGDKSNNSESAIHARKSETSQTYVGIVIGVLSVTVVLLITTIILILRKNRQKIFSKHSMLKSPLADKGGNLNMKDMKLNFTPLASVTMSKKEMYGPGHEDSETDDSTMYHEPYRLTLKKQEHSCLIKNNSCGRLCEYEEFGPLDGAMQAKFGSTPLFNILPSATPAPGPPTSYSFSHNLSTNFKDLAHKQLHNGYSTPVTAKRQPSTRLDPSTRLPNIPAKSESFYAATDIIQSPGPDRILLRGDVFTTFVMAGGRERPDYGEERHINEFPRHKLRLMEKLGEGRFGMVHLCEADGIGNVPSSQSYGQRKTVVVRSLWKNTSTSQKADFLLDADLLSSLTSPWLARVVGVCQQDDPVCIITEYSDYGDLNQFLKNHNPPTPRNSCDTSSRVGGISGGSLIFVATQIASGMKYLEEMGFVHRDLATRNCLVGKGYQIKITDYAMFRSVYSADYYCTEKDEMLPVRWMSWESFTLNHWSSASDVWSYGVVLWELLTHCDLGLPLDELTDAQIVENLNHWFNKDGFQLLPSLPETCSKEMEDLVVQCWSREPADRPNFQQLHAFFQQNHAKYSSFHVTSPS